MSQKPPFSAPATSPENAAFWEASANGRLLFKHCQDCNRSHWYPRALCPWCFSAATQWKEASGRGRIYSYSIVAGDTAGVPAYVQLEEGITLLTRIVDSDPSELAMDKAVSLTFADTPGGGRLPVFRLDGDQ